MKKLLYVIITIPIVILIVSCYPSKPVVQTVSPEVKNVIFLIGDGMGLAHVSSAMGTSASPLNIERTTAVGLQKTFSLNSYTTDSGAAGTALASGTKTYNGAIGVSPGGLPARSVLEIAEEKGLSTGIVSTSAVTHATPASFYAHQSSRISYFDIAKDLLKSSIDVIIGGGYDHFANRPDKINLADSLRAKGYDVETSLDMILKSKAIRLAGFTAPQQNPYRLKGRGDMLPASTGKAIEILSKNPLGFFLMVEGSEIDWAAHANAPDTLIDETLDFDRAVGVALDFAEKNGKTLVVITGDHETGGVTILKGDLKSRKVSINFATKDHTGIMIPVYAFGPLAEKFTGIYDNTTLFEKILSALRLSGKNK